MWGTEITLDDGTVVTYDAEYVTRAIRDPQAQRRPDVSKVPMAAYDASKVTDAQLAEILAFIEDLGPVASTPVTDVGVSWPGPVEGRADPDVTRRGPRPRP